MRASKSAWSRRRSAFPSNDFGDQEPGNNRQIADFCRLTYGIQFPMFAKTTVVGEQANPFYRQLAASSGRRRNGISTNT
jgi:glutathione peroxidase